MLSRQLESTLRHALLIANKNKHEYATFEHLLLALLDDPDTTAIFTSYKVDTHGLKDQLLEYIKYGLSALVDEDCHEAKPTAGFQRVVHRAAVHGNATGQKTITGANLLAEFFFENESYAVVCLKEHGLTRMNVISYLAKNMQNSNKTTHALLMSQEDLSGGENMHKAIKPEDADSITKSVKPQASPIATYCMNLNHKAAEGGIDLLVGREQEVQRTIEILCRRQKNNAILVGEPGVGKTAIAEGLALRIVRRDVPDVLKNTTLYSLDLGSLVAGTRYRGDFEERIKGLLEEIKNKKDTILFIDEIHTMIGAGATNGGSLDASNLLKPALARGEINCIGSTTFKEFRNFFEKDVALMRRFQKVVVDEPSEDSTYRILQGLKSYYEKHHNVTYEDASLRAAVTLSERYITDRHLPDKAIDLMDEAGARKKVLDSKSKTVKSSDIEEMVAMIAHLPSVMVTADDTKKLQKLEQNLETVIFGQSQAISELCASIKLSKAGLRKADRPTGCYLLAGPTGVGKTEFSKQLAKFCSMELIRFDMSEYSEAHSISRLIGTPPGYVGFDQGGLLTEAVAKSPYSVVLFDELEKANSEIFNLLLQVMDHGKLTDSTGKVINFAHTIIIMTTNSGGQEISRTPIGFGSHETRKSSAGMEAIASIFSPEFRSRLDNVIMFNPLDDNIINMIIDKNINELASQLADKSVKIVVEQSAKDYLATHGFDREHGVRKLSRIVDLELKQTIAEEILFGKLQKGGSVNIKYNDAMQFTFEKAKSMAKEDA